MDSLGITVTLVTMLLSVAAPLIIFAVILRKLGFSGRYRRTFGIRIGIQWRVLWLLLSSAFVGLMIATIGGAIHPPLVQPTAQLLCDGTVQMQSQNYSYKPGQSGVSHTISCIAPDGAADEITLSSVFAAAALYGTAIFVLRLLWWLFRRQGDAAGPDTLTGLSPESPSGDGLIDLTRQPGQRGVVTNIRAGTSADINTALQGLSGVLGDQVARSLRQALDSIPEGNINVTVNSNADVQRKVRDFPGAAPGSEADTQPSQDAASRLRQLQSLRDQGLITLAEYDAKRADILKGL